MSGIPNLVMDEHHQNKQWEPTDYVPYKERALAAEAKIGELLAERAKLRGALQAVMIAPSSGSSDWTLTRMRAIASTALKD